VPDAAKVDDLAARKRLLVAECESHRRAFGLELARLQSSIDALARPVKSALSVSRLLVLAAPIAGYALGRRKRRSRGWFKMGLAGWQLFRRFQPLWQKFRRRRHNDT
jgi:hypothetical protein